MTIIDCAGKGRERGLAHGEGARDLVRAALARWREATLGQRNSDAAMMEYASRFLSSTGLMAALETALPDLVEEIRGIADGAGLPYELVAAYNLMDEQWWYDLESPPMAEPGCSLVAVVGTSGSGETLLAQNMDLPAFMDGSQVVLRIRAPGQPEALVLSSAGLIGLAGVSRAGVGVCVNTLLMLRHNGQGVPVAAVFRGALAQATAEKAVSFLTGVSHASGQHYAVADRHGVTGLECSAEGCSVSSPRGRATLTHTNHPLASRDIEPSALSILEQRGRVADSRRRLAFLDEHIGSLGRPADVKHLLADRTTPICMTPTARRPSQTFGSVIFELSDMTRATICVGSPAEAPWHDVSWIEPSGRA